MPSSITATRKPSCRVWGWMPRVSNPQWLSVLRGKRDEYLDGTGRGHAGCAKRPGYPADTDTTGGSARRAPPHDDRRRYRRGIADRGRLGNDRCPDGLGQGYPYVAFCCAVRGKPPYAHEVGRESG